MAKIDRELFSGAVRMSGREGTRPTDALVYASTATSRRQPQDSGSGWIRFLLSCRALSSPTTCRFIPAHPRHGFELRFTGRGSTVSSRFRLLIKRAPMNYV